MPSSPRCSRAWCPRSTGFRATASRRTSTNWHDCDALHDREVRVENAGEITRGVARGIDAHGALLVETPAGVRRFISGEVTVRIDT